METPLRLLIVEDNPGDARLVLEMLREAPDAAWHATAVATLAEALRAIADAPPEAVILDLSLSDSQGLETLRVVREAAPLAAVLVLTGLDDEQSALEAMRRGAQDYLVKGRLLPDSVIRAVRYAVERRRVEHSFRRSEELNRRIIEAMPGGLLTFDAAGACVGANDHALKFLGLSREEVALQSIDSLVGRTILENGASQSPEQFPASRCLTTGRPAGPETLGFRRADGMLSWGVFSATTLVDPSTGRHTGAVVTFMDITERRRAEDALRLSEARHRVLIEAIPDMLLRVSREGVYLDYAPAAEFNPVVPPDRFLGRSFADVLPPQVASTCLESLRLAFETGRTQVVAYQLSGDGELRDYEAAIAPSDEREAIVAVRDVTERRRAEEKIRQSEERYRLLFEHSPEPMWIYDRLTLRFLAVNDAAVRHYGYSRDEFLAMKITDIRPPEDIPRLLREIGEVDPPPLRQSGLWRHRVKAGDLIDVEVASHAVPFIGRDARLVTVRDVTEARRVERERQRALSALRESELRFRTLADSTPVLIWMRGPDLKGTWYNRTWLEYRGTTLEHELREGWEHGLHPDDLDRTTRTCETAYQARQPFTMEYRLRRADGTYGWLLERAQPRFDADGVFQGFIGSCADVSELKQAEAALRASEARLKAIVERTPNVAIEGYDIDGRVLFWNRAAEHLYGWTEREAVGRTLDELILDADGARLFVEALREIDRTGEVPEPSEWEFTRRDGTRGTCYSSIFPIGGDGIRRTFICMDVDITDRRLTEEALRRSESTKRALLDALPDLLFRMRSDGTYLDYIGPPDARLMAPPERFLGHKASEFLADDLARLNAECIERTLATGVVGAYEYRAEREGVTTFYEVRMAPCAPDEVLAVVRDVTARKRAEAALRESENRYRSLVETSPDGIIVHQDGRIVFANESMARLMATSSAADLVGRPVIDLVHPDDRDLVSRRIQRVLSTAEPAPPHVQRLLALDAEVIQAEIAGSICVHNGRPAIQVVVRDVRERRRLEDDLRRAQKIQAVGQLASGVAHDFNNLLTAIFGYTSLAKRTLAAGHPAYRSLERVEEAARQASGVTKALLTFSRNTPGDKRPVRLDEVVQDAVRLFRRTLSASIRLETDLDVRPAPWVNADPTQLQQVVLNLAINARDAMPSGGRLRIAMVVTRGPEPDSPRCDGSEDGPGYVRLLVTDSGVGMSPEVEGRIFEPFFTTKPPESGTGLGLSIVHGIVRDHDGTIAVRTRLGKGSTFTVQFPCVAPAGDRTVAEGPEEVPRGQGESILLVEDHAYVRELIASMLTSGGYDVVQAAGPRDMLRAFKPKGAPIRLVVLDRAVGAEDGANPLDQLRGAGHNVPVVLMVTGPEYLLNTPPDAATILVRKPFQMSELAAAVARGLGRISANGPLDESPDLRASR